MTAPAGSPRLFIDSMETLVAWLAVAAPGEVAVYHRGDLATNRERERALDRLASAMIALAGVGCVKLMSARIGSNGGTPGGFEYRATAALMPARRTARVAQLDPRILRPKRPADVP